MVRSNTSGLLVFAPPGSETVTWKACGSSSSGWQPHFSIKAHTSSRSARRPFRALHATIRPRVTATQPSSRPPNGCQHLPSRTLPRIPLRRLHRARRGTGVRGSLLRGYRVPFVGVRAHRISTQPQTVRESEATDTQQRGEAKNRNAVTESHPGRVRRFWPAFSLRHPRLE